VLSAEVKRLVRLVHCIAPLMGIHASVLVREALLSCTCTVSLPASQSASQQDMQPPSRPASQQTNRADKRQEEGKQGGQKQAAPPVPVMSFIAEWYMTTVVKDHRNIGVCVSRARYVPHSQNQERLC